MEPTEQLFLDAQRGDRQASASFLIWCSGEIGKIAKKRFPRDPPLQAELVSEARIMIMESLPTFEWLGLNQLRAYLAIAFKSAVKKHLRTQARQIPFDEVTDHGDLSGSSDSTDAATMGLASLRITQDQQHSLRQVIGVLQDEESGGMLVAHHMGYTKQEIAQDHGISGTAVAKRLRKIGKKLGRRLK